MPVKRAADQGTIPSLNLNVRGLGESATLALQERCRRRAKDGVRTTNFGLGQSPFQGGVEIERYPRDTRRVLAGLGQRCADLLRDAGLRVHHPEGGFYLFLDFEAHRSALALRGIQTGHELCERLLVEAGVALLPGSVFERSAQELTARLSYVNFDAAVALAASEAVAPHQELQDDFFVRCCAPTLQGCLSIVQWLRGAGFAQPSLTNR